MFVTAEQAKRYDVWLNDADNFCAQLEDQEEAMARIIGGSKSPVVEKGEVPAFTEVNFDGHMEEEVMKRVKAIQTHSPREIAVRLLQTMDSREAQDAQLMLQTIPCTEWDSARLMAAAQTLVKTIGVYGIKNMGPYAVPPQEENSELLRMALGGNVVGAEVIVTNLNIGKVLAAYEFQATHLSKPGHLEDTYALEYRLGSKVIVIGYPSGLPISSMSDVPGFLSVWSAANQKMQFTYVEIDEVEQWFVNMTVYFYHISQAKGVWEVKRDETISVVEVSNRWGPNFAPVIHGEIGRYLTFLKKQPVKKGPFYTGKNGLYDLLCAYVKQFDLDRKLAAQGHSLAKTKIMNDDTRNMIVNPTNDRVQTMMSTLRLHSTAAAVTFRKLKQQARNKGPCVGVTKHLCDPCGPIPRAHAGSAKWETLLSELPDTLPGLKVFGAGALHMLEPVLARNKDAEFYDERQAYIGLQRGTNVKSGSVASQFQGMNADCYVIDDSKATDKMYLAKDFKVEQQYVKLHALISGSYAGGIVRLAVTESEPPPSLNHPLMKLYEAYEDIKYKRPGKLNSTEYYVIFQKKRKERTSLSGERALNHMGAFMARVNVTLAAANSWMDVCTKYGIPAQFPSQYFGYVGKRTVPGPYFPTGSIPLAGKVSYKGEEGNTNYLAQDFADGDITF
jgi:hypothetical protein